MNIKTACINAYQTNEAGTLTIFLEDDQGECAELTIPAEDVPRLMTAGIDALQKKRSTRQ